MINDVIVAFVLAQMREKGPPYRPIAEHIDHRTAGGVHRFLLPVFTVNRCQ